MSRNKKEEQIRIQSAGAMVVTMVTMEEVKQDAKTATSREALS